MIRKERFAVMSNLTKIVLIDSNRLPRAGLSLLIQSQGDAKVLAEVDNCADALSSPEINQCDVVVISIDAPSPESIGPIREVIEQTPNVRLLLLVSGIDRKFYADAVRTGVHGIIDKSEEAAVLLRALRRVKAGEIWLDRRMMIEAISDLRQEMESFKSGTNGTAAQALSEREREVLALVCEGLKNKEIADRLFISPATVRHHLTSIFNKVDVSDRLELVLYAFRNHIASPPV